ncbi:MAG: hypothetical protein A3F72_09255 [Bacteroidetes bacterium RIFCSPLOWO2_12_FULL_35_15]|nr:MAG: hypothetical protein A3F72_09255 [Bacteroidetes bacterium RIFCSPLOWO2_12_FULL_35_15]
MSINKNNYEAFFLDYHEGNLSPQQVADLLLFVEQHPELKEEFESFENFVLEDFSSFEFENKSSLKKQITLENKDDYFIRSVENTLNATEKDLLNNFIKQHPHYLIDLELFKKTKLSVDDSIKFENKNELKRIAITTDNLLISSLEGLLSKEETVLLNQQLVSDAKMKHEFYLYQHTKVIAETSIVFENKEELKRKEKKVIPLFYFVAIAASLLLLFGLSYMYNSNNKEKNFANELVLPKKQIQNNTNNTSTIVKENNQETKIENSKKNVAVVIKNKNIKKQKNTPVPDSKNNSSNLNPANFTEEQKEHVAQNNDEKKKIEIIADNAINKSLKQPAPIDKKNTRLNDDILQENTKSPEYLSLRQLAAEKIKEKTLDEKTLAIEKKSGRLKKFSGWDVAQIITKGISKIIGRNVEVKPTYNDEGEVTAYALGNGIEVTRGRYQVITDYQIR